MRVMRERAARRERLFHPDDAFYGDRLSFKLRADGTVLPFLEAVK